MGMNGQPRRGVRWTLFALAVSLALAALAAGIRPVAADWETGQSAYERGDMAAALEAWRPLAEAGNARAQAALGSLYIRGEALRSTMRKRCAGPGAPPNKATSPANSTWAPSTPAASAWTGTMRWRRSGSRALPSRTMRPAASISESSTHAVSACRRTMRRRFSCSARATIIAGDPEANLQEIGAAAENYAYVVMMTMEEPELTQALERTRAWEKEFLRRYLKRRIRPAEPKGNLDRLPFE